MWFEDGLTLLSAWLLDCMRLISTYPILFTAFILSMVLGIVLFFVRWLYRADI